MRRFNPKAGVKFAPGARRAARWRLARATGPVISVVTIGFGARKSSGGFNGNAQVEQDSPQGRQARERPFRAALARRDLQGERTEKEEEGFVRSERPRQGNPTFRQRPEVLPRFLLQPPQPLRQEETGRLGP